MAMVSATAKAEGKRQSQSEAGVGSATVPSETVRRVKLPDNR